MIQDFEPYVMITSALMLVKRSETAIAVQLCRFLCRFTQLFIYQRKKNTYQYIKVVMISGQMYSPRDLYFTGNIRLLVIRFMVISGQLFGQKMILDKLYNKLKEENMPSNTGYSITTRRLRLCCGHPE